MQVVCTYHLKKIIPANKKKDFDTPDTRGIWFVSKITTGEKPAQLALISLISNLIIKWQPRRIWIEEYEHLPGKVGKYNSLVRVQIPANKTKLRQHLLPQHYVL